MVVLFDKHRLLGETVLSLKKQPPLRKWMYLRLIINPKGSMGVEYLPDMDGVKFVVNVYLENSRCDINLTLNFTPKPSLTVA